MTSQTTLADRNEIHKSCRTLEGVVNILNDYCEAANAILVLRKKLAKALREAATVKCVAEIPANALNISAVMFETLADVDSKFVKLADKECDGVSAEVKKWFKKLAKLEKEHDEKIAKSNYKIKQAGQLYEKKAKKNPQDAAEEHARYISVLSTVGPEMNQENYNHALLVTQRHSGTLHSLAACLARVADGEWLRSCEGVRQFSPTVGQLGQWRAFCEGGWSGPMPGDLPNIDPSPGMPAQEGRPVTPNVQDSPRDLTVPAPEYSSRRPSEQEPGESVPPRYAPISGGQPKEGDARAPSPREFADRKSHSTASLTSLASFPSPPTHFPLPPVTILESNNSDNRIQDRRGESSDAPSTGNTKSPVPLAPIETVRTEGPRPLPQQPRSPPTATPTASSTKSESRMSNDQAGNDATNAPENRTANEHPSSQPPSPVVARSPAEIGSSTTSAATTEQAMSLQKDERGDGGTCEDAQVDKLNGSTSRALQTVERSDTGKSNGSVVAALRDRYARTAVPSSPPRKEVPQLPATSVSNLAYKYEPIVTSPTSPRLGPAPPTDSRRRLSADMSQRTAQPMRTSPGTGTGRYTAAGSSPDNITLRRRRVEELEELELREQELELRMKEREIERRAKELDLERARILNARSPDSGYGSDVSRAGILDRLSRHPVEPSPASSDLTRPRPNYPLHSFSTTNLNAHLSVRPSSSQQGSSSSQPSSPLYSPTDHAPYCGCEACSASKYRVRDQSPSARDVRPLQPPITLRPEKPKGWIRRLSMPVMGNAFSLDSKKNLSNVGIAGGPGSRNSFTLAEEDGRLRRDVGGDVRNRSTTNLARR